MLGSRKFALDYNGIQLLPPAPRKPWVIECDATLSAAGAFSKQRFYAEEFPPDVTSSNFNITHLEAFNLIHALTALLPPSPQECLVIVNTDNETSQQVLQTGRSKDSFLCACARQIWLIPAKLNFELEIHHKAGKDLVLADALSRSFTSIMAKLKASNLLTSLGLIKKTVFLTANVIDFSI